MRSRSNAILARRLSWGDRLKRSGIAAALLWLASLAHWACAQSLPKLFQTSPLPRRKPAETTPKVAVTGHTVRPTGMMMPADENFIHYDAPTEDTPIEVGAPLDMQVPTFASDFNSAAMGKKLSDKLESQYRDQMAIFVSMHGLDRTNQDALARDHGSARPFMMPLKQELEVRHQMALSARQYMLLKGVPAWLATREETKAIAAAYQEVGQIAHVQGVTKDEWKYGLGVDPMALRSWVNYSNTKWLFEATTYFSSFQHVHDTLAVEAERNYKFSSLRSKYWPMLNLWQPSVVHYFAPTMRSSIETDVPLSSEQLSRDIITRVAIAYVF